MPSELWKSNWRKLKFGLAAITFIYLGLYFVISQRIELGKKEFGMCHLVSNYLVFSCAWFSDLVPREAAEKWLNYLREELPAVAFKCSTQEQRSNLGWKSSSKAAKTKSNLLQTSDCLGADTLLKLLKNYSRSHEVLKLFSFGFMSV